MQPVAHRAMMTALTAFQPSVSQGRTPCREQRFPPLATATATRAPTNNLECTRMSAELISHEEIQAFFNDGWIDEVLFPVKSGKEATVYCCRACPERGEPISP